jgi:hypothetical protein
LNTANYPLALIPVVTPVLILSVLPTGFMTIAESGLVQVASDHHEREEDQ